MLRTRWAAIGAAVAVTLCGGGVGLVGATITSGPKPVFVPITACRLVDTRPALQVGPRGTPLGAGETYDVAAHGTNGECSLPDHAEALSLNVTAVGATLPTFLTIWSDGEPRPNASSLNPVPDQPPTPNAATTEISEAGRFSIYNKQGTVHVIVDVNGYYADHTHDEGKAISLDPAGWHKSGGAVYQTSGGTQNTGLAFPATGFPSAAFSAVLPPDVTPGTDLRLDIYWHVLETGCTVSLEESATGAVRLGAVIVGESTTRIPHVVFPPIIAGQVFRYSVRWESTDGFRPGDIVKYELFRNDLDDTCTKDVFIDGARLLYDYP